MQRILLLAILVLGIPQCQSLHTHNHNYAAAQQTYFVSQSQNLRRIYSCMNNCFALNDTFVYPMKYWRIVWTEQFGDRVYMQGHCYANLNISTTDTPKSQDSDKQQEWTPIKELETKLSLSSKEPKTQRLKKFVNQCQNPTTEIPSKLRTQLGLTAIHSQYFIYSNGTFVNTQESKQLGLDQIVGKLGNLK